MHPEFKRRINAVKVEMKRLSWTHQWAPVVKRNVRLKHVFGSVFVCGQQFTQMKTFSVRKYRYIKRKALGFIKTLERTIKFMVLDHKRLDFFHFQTFPPNPFKVSKPGFPILEKNTLLRRSKSLRQNRHSNENGNTYNHLKSDTKHDNFNWLFSIYYNSTLSREAWRQIETKLTESMLIYFSSSSLQLASRHAAGFFYAPCQRESNVNLISCSNLRSWLVLLPPIWYR